MTIFLVGPARLACASRLCRVSGSGTGLVMSSADDIQLRPSRLDANNIGCLLRPAKMKIPQTNCDTFMVGPARLELTTPASQTQCSSLLSYGPMTARLLFGDLSSFASARRSPYPPVRLTSVLVSEQDLIQISVLAKLIGGEIVAGLADFGKGECLTFSPDSGTIASPK